MTASQDVRLCGSNLPADVPFETDAHGSPLRDLETNSAAVNATTAGDMEGSAKNLFLKIRCIKVGTSAFDVCPSHSPFT